MSKFPKTSFITDSQAVKVALPQDEYDGSEFLENWLWIGKWMLPIRCFGAIGTNYIQGISKREN